MKPDLIFHAVSKRLWRERNTSGYYTISDEGTEQHNPVECVEAEHVDEYLNTNFKGRKTLFLLVIDTSRVVNRVSKGDKPGSWLVDTGVNVDAVLDKIRIDSNKEGYFDLEVESS